MHQLSLQVLCELGPGLGTSVLAVLCGTGCCCTGCPCKFSVNLVQELLMEAWPVQVRAYRSGHLPSGSRQQKLQLHRAVSRPWVSTALVQTRKHSVTVVRWVFSYPCASLAGSCHGPAFAAHTHCGCCVLLLEAPNCVQVTSSLHAVVAMHNLDACRSSCVCLVAPQVVLTHVHVSRQCAPCLHNGSLWMHPRRCQAGPLM